LADIWGKGRSGFELGQLRALLKNCASVSGLPINGIKHFDARMEVLQPPQQ
jgi:hypothetical protein